jgi:hypothetical protein
MTDEIHLWDYEILCLADGEIAFEESCCCCLWPDCCGTFFFSSYNRFLIKFNSCGPEVCTGSAAVVDSIYGLEYDSMTGAFFADASDYVSGEPLVGVGWWLKLECLSEGEINGSANFRVTFYMNPGVECCPGEMTFTWDFSDTCFPFGYSNTADWSGDPYYCTDWYSGCMSFEIYRAACTGPPDDCTCSFLNVCTPPALMGIVSATGTCADPMGVNIDAAVFYIDCTGNCTWESDGCVCLDVAEACCYKFVLEGTADVNRYCDFVLSIYDCANNLIWQGAATSGLVDPFDLTFTGVTLDCCSDPIDINITYY